MADLKRIAKALERVAMAHEFTLRQCRRGQCGLADELARQRCETQSIRQHVKTLRQPDVTQGDALAAIEAACTSINKLSLELG
jgi:hypothetical protein